VVGNCPFPQAIITLIVSHVNTYGLGCKGKDPVAQEGSRLVEMEQLEDMHEDDHHVFEIY
jgi:hypothetical protein